MTMKTMRLESPETYLKRRVHSNPEPGVIVHHGEEILHVALDLDMLDSIPETIRMILSEHLSSRG